MITAYIVGLFITFIIVAYIDFTYSENNNYLGMGGCLLLSVIWPFTLLSLIVLVVSTLVRKK